MNEYVSDQFGKLPLHEIGITANPFKDPLEELKAKIKFGASKVELGFSGRGKGAEGQTVPDVVGMDAREDIRRLAEENEVELTTHATFSIPPVSGFTGKEFDRTVSENSQMEIRRAIDFAADTTKGGAIVFHLGEWQRPSSEIGEEFEEYEYQRTKLNEKTGKMDLVFINGKPDMIKSSDERNVLLANTETGEVTSLSKKQKYFLSGIEKEDGKFNLDEKRKPVIDPLEHKDVKEYTWESIKLKLSDGKHKADDDEVAKFLLDHNFERQKMKIEGEKAYYKRLAGQGDSAEAKSFLSTINALKQQEAQLEEDKNKYKTVKKVGLQRSAEAISNLGLYAMEKTKVIKKRGTLEKPLYVSPENVFSEQYGYGSAPDEMIDIVKESRKVMSQRLQMKGKSATEANQLAEDHIKATFDMAHLNTHYKYFKGNQKEFKKWMVKNVRKLRKAGVLGHIHISDNFGYSDEHTDPGQGTTPIREVIEELRKSNEKYDFIVETGGQGDRAFLAGFSHITQDIHGLTRPTSIDPWNIVEHSYFGKTAPPYFVVGAYAKQMGGEMGQKQFSTWAGIPFE